MVRISLAAVGVLGLVGAARAEIVSAVGASTDMGSWPGTQLVDAISGAGLSSLSLDAVHASSLPGNSWYSGVGEFSGLVTFDLGEQRLIDGFSVWNVNDGVLGPDGGAGVSTVSVLGSVDGVTFTAIPGAPTRFSRRMGEGPVAAEAFSFAPVSASHIRFFIVDNWGDPNAVGFAEVQFSAVPGPGGGAALLAGLGMLAAGRRRGNSGGCWNGG